MAGSSYGRAAERRGAHDYAPTGPANYRPADYPQHYRGERLDPGCGFKRPHRITVHDPWTVEHTCECGNTWVASVPKPEGVA